MTDIIDTVHIDRHGVVEEWVVDSKTAHERWRQVHELIGTDSAHHIVLSALSNADLIEHGGGIGGSWITDKGRWLLRAIEKGGDAAAVDDAVHEVGLPHNGGDCTEDCWKVPSDG